MTGLIRALLAAAAVALMVAAPAYSQDRSLRAKDAVNFFGGVCGRGVANWEPEDADHQRYRLAWMTQKQAADISDSLSDLVVWMVAAPDSDLVMIHYVTRSGICGVEVEAADEAMLKAGFDALVQSAARGMSLQAELRSDKTDADGFREKIWRLGKPGAGYEVGLSVTPDAAAPPKFIMTMAKLKAEAKP